MRLLFLFVVFLGSSVFLQPFAQEDEPAVYRLIKELPPLDSLIQMAIDNSPKIQAQQERILKERANFKIVKKSWLDNLFGDVGYLYTNGFSTVNLSNNGNGSESNTLQVGDSYRAGINLRLSVFDIIGRKYQKQVARQDLKIARLEKDIQIADLSKVIKDVYAELGFLERRMVIINAKKQALFLNYQLAEKKFLEGQIDVAELSRMIEFSSKSEEEYQKSRLDLELKLLELESLVGASLR